MDLVANGGNEIVDVLGDWNETYENSDRNMLI